MTRIRRTEKEVLMVPTMNCHRGGPITSKRREQGGTGNSGSSAYAERHSVNAHVYEQKRSCTLAWRAWKVQDSTVRCATALPAQLRNPAPIDFHPRCTPSSDDTGESRHLMSDRGDHAVILATWSVGPLAGHRTVQST
nr:hypothetical protein CFP56_04257 [Quercus suber]